MITQARSSSSRSSEGIRVRVRAKFRVRVRSRARVRVHCNDHAGAQLFFSLFVLVAYFSRGSAFGYPFLVLGLWKFGFPETVAPLRPLPLRLLPLGYSPTSSARAVEVRLPETVAPLRLLPLRLLSLDYSPWATPLRLQHLP